MENSEHKWKPKIENCKKLKLDDARFFFEQAEKFLQDVTDSHKTIVDRSNALLAIILTILSGLIAFNVDRIQKMGWKDNFSISTWILITYLSLAIIYLVLNIKPIRYMALGSQPKTIFTDFFFRATVPDKERIIRMYISETERYQHRIEVNMKINEKRWKIYKNSLYVLLGIPFVFLISYFLLIFVKCA